MLVWQRLDPQCVCTVCKVQGSEVGLDVGSFGCEILVEPDRHIGITASDC